MQRGDGGVRVELDRGADDRLAERRREELASAGRVEVGRGALREIARRFCDSPHVRQENYEDVFAGLLDVFYRCKEQAEAGGGLADEELIEALHVAFGAEAGGATEALGAFARLSASP